jgi:hypothetical protein
MKKVFFILSILSFTALFSQTKKVKIKLTQTVPYCGGARPTPEMEAQQKIPVAYANKKLICISATHKIDTLTTDVKGYLITNLTIGTYNFFEPWKYYKKNPTDENENNINMDCLSKEWTKPDLIITVSKKIKLINNIEYKICPYRFPCIIERHLPQ